MNEKYYVIAGNRVQYLDFAQKKCDELWNAGNTSISLSHFVHVDDITKLKGVSNPTGFFIGTWYMRDDIRDILSQLFTCCSNHIKKAERIREICDMLVEIESKENLYK